MPPETNFGEEEIQAMLDDVGRPITIGATTVNGSIRRADEEILMAGLGHLIGKSVQVTLKKGSLPGLAIGAAITVDGTAMKVAAVYQSVNGVVERAVCAVE